MLAIACFAELRSPRSQAGNYSACRCLVERSQYRAEVSVSVLIFRPLDAARPRISLQYGFSRAFRPFCCHGNAGILRLGRLEPVVHSGLRRRVRSRVGVWLPAGCLAFRRGRGHLGRHSSMALANEDEQSLEAQRRESALPRGGDAAECMLLSPFRAGAAHIVLFGLIGSRINGDQHTQ